MWISPVAVASMLTMRCKYSKLKGFFRAKCCLLYLVGNGHHTLLVDLDDAMAHADAATLCDAAPEK
jgi:hypothetical protein